MLDDPSADCCAVFKEKAGSVPPLDRGKTHPWCSERPTPGAELLSADTSLKLVCDKAVFPARGVEDQSPIAPDRDSCR